jgi:branched-chain amino acid transport system ATP-binding protein
MTPVLEVEQVSKRFGGVQAVSAVSFSVGESELFSVIGPNGAGKTTLLNIISGLVRPDHGQVKLQGRDMSHQPTWRNAGLGLARTLQTPVVFPDMTVLDNLMLGHVARSRVSFIAALFMLPSVRRWEREARAKAEDLLDLLGLEGDAGRVATELPLGLQRLVEIGRGLATEPRVILLDEPAAGLAAGEVDRLAVVLRASQARGVAVCLVEHNMRLVMEIAERILVLHQGRPLFEGTPSEVQEHPDVIAAYLGSDRPRIGLHAAG